MLTDGLSYTVDGDVVDSRDQLIRSLKSEIATYRTQENADRATRDKNPAVKDAWDQYQTLLILMRQR